MNQYRNLLSNGRFLHNLSGWTPVNASYNAGDGDDHYGIALIAAGGSIAQQFSVTNTRKHTLHLAVKANDVTIAITDGNGDAVLTSSATGAASWTETTLDIGLATGGSYTLTISAAAEAKVDDVWLWPVPLTRTALAMQIDAKLGRLATERSLSYAVNGALTEGDYTYAVDAGLRSVGAIDPETDLPDVRWLDSATVDVCLDAIELEMLERLQRDYATEVDIQIGPRRESLSQISAAIAKLTGTAGGSGSSGGRVVMREMRHQ